MTWHYQTLAGIPRSTTSHVERRTSSLPFLHWVDRLWIRRQKTANRRIPVRARHWGLWSCIHSGEGDSHPSSSHPYSGPLQMTSYWAGYPVYDWEAIPRARVYADAEQQLQVHIARGDVSGWLAQQWPNTSGGCLGYL